MSVIQYSAAIFALVLILLAIGHFLVAKAKHPVIVSVLLVLFIVVTAAVLMASQSADARREVSGFIPAKWDR